MFCILRVSYRRRLTDIFGTGPEVGYQTKPTKRTDKTKASGRESVDRLKKRKRKSERAQDRGGGKAIEQSGGPYGVVSILRLSALEVAGELAAVTS